MAMFWHVLPLLLHAFFYVKQHTFKNVTVPNKSSWVQVGSPCSGRDSICDVHAQLELGNRTYMSCVQMLFVLY